MTASKPVSPALSVVVALAAGAFGVAAFAPFYFWPAALVSVGALFILWWQAQTVWRAVGITMVWGMAYFGTGVSWLYISLHDYGEMPAWLAAPAIALFCALLSFLMCLGAYLQHILRRRCDAGPRLALLGIMPAAFVLAEMFRGWIFGGFPWLTVGLSQTPGGGLPPLLAGYAPVVGAFGLSWLICLLAGLIVPDIVPELRTKIRSGLRRGHAMIAMAILLGGVLANLIPWTEPTGAPLTTALVQGNIDQRMKWREEEIVPTLELHRQMAASAQARLIVLPETVAPVFLDYLPKEYTDSLQTIAAKEGGDLLFGVPTRRESKTDGTLIFNSVISLGSSPIQRYNKSHLVIFGEYTPRALGWVMEVLHIPMSGFTPGAEPQQPLRVAGETVAVNICYEDAFGDEVVRQLPAATLLVNVSNMAWFGHSWAAAQHGQMSQMRAQETGRWMLRTTNTGLTAAINERGEIVKALPEFTRGVLTAEAQPRRGATPYVRWSDWPVRIGVVLLLAFCAFRGKTGKKPA